MEEFKYLVHDDEGKIEDKIFANFADAFDYAQGGLVTFIDEIPYQDGEEVEDSEQCVWTWDDISDKEQAIQNVQSLHNVYESVDEDNDLVDCIWCLDAKPKKDCVYDADFGWICNDCLPQIKAEHRLHLVEPPKENNIVSEPIDEDYRTTANGDIEIYIGKEEDDPEAWAAYAESSADDLAFMPTGWVTKQQWNDFLSKAKDPYWLSWEEMLEEEGFDAHNSEKDFNAEDNDMTDDEFIEAFGKAMKDKHDLKEAASDIKTRFEITDGESSDSGEWLTDEEALSRILTFIKNCKNPSEVELTWIEDNGDPYADIVVNIDQDYKYENEDGLPYFCSNWAYAEDLIKQAMGLPGVDWEKENKFRKSRYDAIRYQAKKDGTWNPRKYNKKEDNLEISEETHAQFAKPEGNRVQAFNNALKYAKKENKPFIYGYTAKTKDGDIKFFALENPTSKSENEFKGQYKNCMTVYIAYPDKSFVKEDCKLKEEVDQGIKELNDDAHKRYGINCKIGDIFKATDGVGAGKTLILIGWSRLAIGETNLKFCEMGTKPLHFYLYYASEYEDKMKQVGHVDINYDEYLKWLRDEDDFNVDRLFKSNPIDCIKEDFTGTPEERTDHLKYTDKDEFDYKAVLPKNITKGEDDHCKKVNPVINHDIDKEEKKLLNEGLAKEVNFDIDDSDINARTGEANIFASAGLDNDHIILINLTTEFDIGDFEYTWEPDGEPTYVPYGDREVMYDNGKGGLESVDISEDFEWNIEYTTADEQPLTKEQAGQILGLDLSGMNQLEQEARNEANEYLAEDLKEQIEDNSDLWPDQEDDYEPEYDDFNE